MGHGFGTTKLSDVKAGDRLLTDNGFTCVEQTDVVVKQDENGLFFECDDGKHFLDGQVDGAGNLVGLKRWDGVTFDFALTVVVNHADGREWHDLETKCHSFKGIPKAIEDLIKTEVPEDGRDYSSLVVVIVPTGKF